MTRHWRRLRTVVTILMTLIGAGLLTLAWFSIGTVPGEAAVDMAMFGLVLPIGFYIVFTLVGWQRSAGSGVAPGGFMRFCLRCQLGMVAPMVFMFLLLGMINNASHALDRHAATPSASTVKWSDTYDAASFRRACVNKVTSIVHPAGGDQAALHSRIDGYCGCIVVGLQNSYTESELDDLPSRVDASKDPRYTRVIQQCQASSKT